MGLVLKNNCESYNQNKNVTFAELDEFLLLETVFSIMILLHTGELIRLFLFIQLNSYFFISVCQDRCDPGNEGYRPTLQIALPSKRRSSNSFPFIISDNITIVKVTRFHFSTFMTAITTFS